MIVTEDSLARYTNLKKKFNFNLKKILDIQILKIKNKWLFKKVAEYTNDILCLNLNTEFIPWKR